MSADILPPLREVISRHGLTAQKNLGQNFLFDLNLTQRIARSAGPFGSERVIEIGPGPGGLTRALLNEGVNHLSVIERDPRVLPVMEEIAQAYPQRMDVQMADALKLNWDEMLQRPCRIVANLPYNIATALLVRWLSIADWPSGLLSLTLMFQKEVALRIVAKPGTGDYGRLSVLAQWRTQPRKLFDVHRSAFTPAPKVTSSIVELIPKPLDPSCHLSDLEKMTQAGFGQRRKMLRQSLRSVLSNPENVLQRLGIDPELRAENLTVTDFVRLAQTLRAS